MDDLPPVIYLSDCILDRVAGWIVAREDGKTFIDFGGSKYYFDKDDEDTIWKYYSPEGLWKEK